MEKIKIILVDDDFIFLEMLEAFLSDIGNLEIVKVRTGEECLKIIDKSFHTMVLDYFLNSENPDAQNGLEILKKVRSIVPRIKVIVLSGQEDGNLVYDFVRENVDNYVVKDDNAFDNVKKAIESLLE
ncbi:MAG TPA: response regulator [Salinivirgaceae bacterium]|nr:response regulator [Salinivirgaceae bacterium]